MGRTQSNEKKLSVLEVVKENKNILFGSFQNNANTKKNKEEAWTKVLNKAQSLRLTGPNRQWSYARDHLFGLWKSRTLAKRHNSKKTRTGGAKEAVLNEVDKIILDIIGKDSAVVEGLGSPETGGKHLETTPEVKQESVSVPQVSSSRITGRRRGSKRRYEEPLELERIKIKVLASEFHLNCLNILKIEKEYRLAPSKFTKELQCVVEYDSGAS